MAVHPGDELLHLGHDFRADPVAGEKKEIVRRHGCPRLAYCTSAHGNPSTVAWTLDSRYFVFPAQADEGMWTFNNFPSDKVEQAYGFRPDQAWLDHVRLSSLRLARGCSASFVSPHGLVQTNHHCARDCIAAALDRDAGPSPPTAFYAARPRTSSSVRTSRSTSSSTSPTSPTRIRKAHRRQGRRAPSPRRSKPEKAAIAEECSAQRRRPSAATSSSSIAAASTISTSTAAIRTCGWCSRPKKSIAFFGGDPDNFDSRATISTSRYLRVYRDGKPLDTRANYLCATRAGGCAAGRSHLHLRSSRHRPIASITVAELEFQRDVKLPRSLVLAVGAARPPDRVLDAGARSRRASPADQPVRRRELASRRSKGQFEALVDPTHHPGPRPAAEQALRAKVDADPALRARVCGAAWDNIRAHARRAVQPASAIALYEEPAAGFTSRCFGDALTLVRRAAEAAQADDDAAARVHRRELSDRSGNRCSRPRRSIPSWRS